jgi:lipopolysaccharide/colanic/teichoic acid biosynthesis glycosyltransferase
MKRFLDMVCAVFGLLLLSPLLAVIAVAVRINMGRPVLFKQLRPGLHGKPFCMLKFRTMRDDVDRHGNARPDGQRLTALGRFLRRASMDELPELWNVAVGHMSLVGPRPLLMEYLSLYSPEQARRNEVRPGITGWAQVNGRNAISWEQKFAYDIWYVDHQSSLLDLRIIGMTIKKVLQGEGVCQEGQATAEKFRGDVP